MMIRQPALRRCLTQQSRRVYPDLLPSGAAQAFSHGKARGTDCSGKIKRLNWHRRPPKEALSFNHSVTDVKDSRNVQSRTPRTARFNSTMPLNELPEMFPRGAHEPIAVPSFDDPVSAHGSKSGKELLRAVLVYRMCRIQFLVKHSETLLAWSRKMLGPKFTDWVMKSTFFGHFCAGEDEKSIGPVIDRLRHHGIGGILDYAAEGVEDGKVSTGDNDGQGIVSRPPYNQPARVYDYKSESQCDRHLETFLKCIHAVRDVSPDGFAAIKVTALGNPLLLERMSTAITEAKSLFKKFDLDNDGLITRREFAGCYGTYFNDSDNNVGELLSLLDPNNSDAVDYIEWSKLLAPSSLPQITASCKDIGPLALATPSLEEISLFGTMQNRLHNLAEEAFRSGVRLLIDAEHLKFQPAIDNLVLDLQQKYNDIDRTNTPIIFGTYQCYLKDALERIELDLKRSERYSYHFATKLVRGAYMVHERERAKAMGYPDPIHESLADTHSCYDTALERILRHRAEKDLNLEVMCATHNRSSIERAIDLMNRLDIKPSDGVVHFAQLYGMSDNLTYPLGGHGFRAYKYVPYGKVAEVMPYLMRRAQENSGMMGGASEELQLVSAEVRRRVFSS